MIDVRRMPATSAMSSSSSALRRNSSPFEGLPAEARVTLIAFVNRRESSGKCQSAAAPVPDTTPTLRWPIAIARAASRCVGAAAPPFPPLLMWTGAYAHPRRKAPRSARQAFNPHRIATGACLQAHRNVRVFSRAGAAGLELQFAEAALVAEHEVVLYRGIEPHLGGLVETDHPARVFLDDRNAELVESERGCDREVLEAHVV